MLIQTASSLMTQCVGRVNSNRPRVLIIHGYVLLPVAWSLYATKRMGTSPYPRINRASHQTVGMLQYMAQLNRRLTRSFSTSSSNGMKLAQAVTSEGGSLLLNPMMMGNVIRSTAVKYPPPVSKSIRIKPIKRSGQTWRASRTLSCRMTFRRTNPIRCTGYGTGQLQPALRGHRRVRLRFTHRAWTSTFRLATQQEASMKPEMCRERIMANRQYPLMWLR